MGVVDVGVGLTADVTELDTEIDPDLYGFAVSTHRRAARAITGEHEQPEAVAATE